jgi:predicted regulator of Ras-like GTPase activity (Roadblock/LC7/MglB family)
MHNEAYSIALKNALLEIKNICPDVSTSFLFEKDGTIIAGDNETSEVPVEKAVGALEGIFEKTETIGGLDVLVVDGQKGKVHISCVNDMYLALVTSKSADMTYLQTVSRVLIPTVIKLLDNITPTSTKFPSTTPSFAPLPKSVEQEEMEEEVEAAQEETEEEIIDEEEEGIKPKRLEIPPEREMSEPASQLVVDTLSGLLVRGDTVQIDAEILNEWSEHYDGVEITEVEIETFSGDSTVCKVKPIKDSRIEGKGIIRIPDRACQDLNVKKGELVKVKPYLEEE